MTPIVENLSKLAEMEKVAYVDYVKAFSSSAIITLVEGGMSFEKAASVAEEAVQSDSRAVDLLQRASVFEKVASHVAGLESEVTGLREKVASVEEVETKDNEQLYTKLAGLGFSEEEIESISALPTSTIEKVASARGNSEPWGMGSGHGAAIEKMDPMLRFLMGED